MTEFAIVRAQSSKRSANGVSVRFLTVTKPTRAGGDTILTDKILRRMSLPLNRMTEAGTRRSQWPVSTMRI